MAKEKIAVLGGGVGALSAVYAITSQPGWEEKYDITVYQLGWRLGGKGATGRDMTRGSRIQEHGYHMLFGFYGNTFAMLRQCYAELDRDPSQPISEVVALSSEDETKYPGRYAFHRQSTAVLLQKLADGTWHNFVFDFPPNTDLPGDAGELPHPLAYIEMAVEMLVRLVGDIKAEGGARPQVAETLWDRIKAATPGLLVQLDPKAHALSGHRGHLELIRQLVRHLVDARAPGTVVLDAVARAGLHILADLMRAYLRLVWSLVGHDVQTNWDHFRLWTASDFVCTAVIGAIEDDIIGKGIDSVDGLNFCDWFMSHATVPEGAYVTASSCWMQSAYDSSFAYENGDTTSPRTPTKPLLGTPTLAASTAIRGALRLALTYKGAMAWKFQAGCAEALVAPVYQVLLKRGVKFSFFSKVQHLGVARDKGLVVDSITIQTQATVKNGDYQPLIDVKGLLCWPSEPLWDQLKEGDRIRGYDLESDFTPWQGVGTSTLKRGVDFDRVLLAIPIGALPAICGELISASPAWQRMIQAIPTVRTQALQAWVKKDLADLGWTGPDAPTGTGVEPWDTWADMTELLAREDWAPGPDAPSGVSYFCCAMPDDPNQPQPPDAAYPPSQLDLTRTGAVAFLDTQSSQFWPKAHAAKGFDWQVLAASSANGSGRLDDQYLRANIDAGERYVLSPPGSVTYRPRAEGAGFDNLTLAGDWTNTTINAGCMEATVISGLAASRAITGVPKAIPGEEDFGTGGPRRDETGAAVESV